MRRRLDLAGALVAGPQVLFLDEPTTGLDPRSRKDMWDVIARAGRRRHHAAAHHAVPGGGRPAGRRDRRHRPRQGHRPGHGRRAEGPGRRRARRGRGRRDAPGSRDAVRVLADLGRRRRRPSTSTPARSPSRSRRPAAAGVLIEALRELDAEGDRASRRRPAPAHPRRRVPHPDRPRRRGAGRRDRPAKPAGAPMSVADRSPSATAPSSPSATSSRSSGSPTCSSSRPCRRSCSCCCSRTCSAARSRSRA